MNTTNGVTTYQQSDLKREALAILKTEKYMRETKGQIVNISWSISIGEGITTLRAQGFINHNIIEASLAL